MKTLPGALASHYQLGTTTLAHIILITRGDGAVFAYTSASDGFTLDGVAYDATQGLDVSSLVLTAGLAVDNLNLTTLHDGTVFTTPEVLSGVWRNAEFLISECNWAAPSDGANPLIGGTFGEVVVKRGSVEAELRDLKQYLQQPVGIVTSKTCRARLGDAACGINLASWTHSTTVTAAGQQTFTASGLAQAADYFGYGLVTFDTGACAGITQQIKTHASGGVLTLTLPMLLPVANGDAITVVAGCRKRLEEDCRDKFDNVINFQGEPHLPGIDALTSAP